MKQFIIVCIEWYQQNFSNDHSKHASGFCRFTPSCSEYSKQCFKKYSLLIAFYKSIVRIFKCHPFSKGGIDLP